MIATYTQPAAPWQQLRLWCPGTYTEAPAPVWFGDPIYLNKNSIRRIALAVLVQALRDAWSTDRLKAEERAEARAWLLAEGATWCATLGMRIHAQDFADLAAKGWPRFSRRFLESTGCEPDILDKETPDD